MGIKVPPVEPEFGDDCVSCFPLGETPSYCYLSINGVSKGAGWLEGMPNNINGTFKLVQLPIEPCHYSHFTGETSYIYLGANWIGHPGDSGVRVAIINPGFQFVWDGGKTFICQHNFTNQLTEPPNRPFIGGSAIIFFP